MLIRPHDDGSADDSHWRSFVNAQGFGHLVACGQGRPIPVVVPTQFVLVDDSLVLHLAKPNPILACLAESDQCNMSIAGDWAYIPGAWRAIDDEDPRRGIPTTFYGAVQMTDIATIFDDSADTAAVLRTQLGDLEPNGDYVDPIEHRDHIADQLRSRGAVGDEAALRHMER